MDKQVILAVAGAGKTYHICNELDPLQRNLIIAFTHENISNIKNELMNAYGGIPELTTVSTFDSFVYHECVLPYEPTISQCFREDSFQNRGITLKKPPEQTILRNGRPVANPFYARKDSLNHYVADNKQYYYATLSELVIEVSKKDKAFIKRLTARINRFYDCVLIDEFQDFREFDYDLILKLSKKTKKIILVGDYFQHSVSGTNNTGRPFKKKKAVVDYDSFVTDILKAGFNVDTSTLKSSRRCSKSVCQYIAAKLGIPIESQGINEGAVIWIDKDPETILDDSTITKLVFSGSQSYSFKSMNWSYSKGDTINTVCVILIKDFENLNNDLFSTDKISAITLNKLYVAMTRSKGDLYLMPQSIFKRVKQKYLLD